VREAPVQNICIEDADRITAVFPEKVALIQFLLSPICISTATDLTLGFLDIHIGRPRRGCGVDHENEPPPGKGDTRDYPKPGSGAPTTHILKVSRASHMASVQREHLATRVMSRIQRHQVAQTCILGEGPL
jgi:hypothetical protein